MMIGIKLVLIDKGLFQFLKIKKKDYKCCVNGFTFISLVQIFNMCTTKCVNIIGLKIKCNNQ